MSGKKVSDC